MTIAEVPTPPSKGWFRLRTVLWAVGALIAGWIGFLSASVDLMDKIWPAKSDAQIPLLPSETGTTALDEHHPLDSVPDVLKSGVIIIDGVQLRVPRDGLVIANRIEMRHGGSITGSRFAVAATAIEGGEIMSTGKDGSAGSGTASPSPGEAGGALLVATASISGTPIRSDGGIGGARARGADGVPAPRAASGRDGDCSGFGGYKGNTDGAAGQPGNPGRPGQDGSPGGKGGEVLVLLSRASPQPPFSAGGGGGGGAGAGGTGAPGQLGGAGGAGCVGLGGSQNTARNGPDGAVGANGAAGANGTVGRNGTAALRLIAFEHVAKEWQKAGGDKNRFLSALRQLQD